MWRFPAFLSGVLLGQTLNLALLNQDTAAWGLGTVAVILGITGAVMARKAGA